ncbi:unnamed protein product [Caenorhabditis auriculariae]|uniref:Aminoacyl-transfer RNA synthetases class-II family profile domain-containing protein n=1 Tax=Caenorhabditis auriculariae TaxID=2777116 RepID=A0A8S1HWC0_9PELO|nr:unnamed protein product [Caenorhabditis auriculariae]
MLRRGVAWSLHRFISSVNLYTSRSHNCGELTLENIGQAVTVTGWLAFKRMDKFLVLRDAYGSVQATLPKTLQTELKDIPYESVIRVNGVVADRGKDRNNKTATGMIEIVVEKLTVLNRAAVEMPMLPEARTTERTKMKYRYIDLRSSRMQRALRLRSQLVHDVRRFFVEERQFVDVETPTLFRRTPGGAAEFIVPASQPNLGSVYSLPQSPQQFKQLLMVGAIDRYFQIARCYRDEGSKGDRQPEFTQIDVEMSFTSQEGVMSLIEDMVVSSWPKSLENLKPTGPFPRLRYEDAMRWYGTDKPDMRIPWRIQEAHPILNNLASDKIVDSKWVVRLFKCEGLGNLSVPGSLRKEWKRLLSLNSRETNFAVCSPQKKHWFNFVTNREVSRAHDATDEDLLVVAWGSCKSVQWTLGQLRNFLAEAANLRSRKEIVAHWVIDFPLFTVEDNELTSTHHPFTAPVEKDEVDLKSTRKLPEIIGQHYDLVMNGVEMGGGSIRIHDADLQAHVLEILKEPTAEMTHLLNALSHGAPPHGGFAMGLDRYVSLLCAEGDPSLPVREVIAFPKTKDGKDLMSDAPTIPNDEQLERFGVLIEAPSANVMWLLLVAFSPSFSTGYEFKKVVCKSAQVFSGPNTCSFIDGDLIIGENVKEEDLRWLMDLRVLTGALIIKNTQLKFFALPRLNTIYMNQLKAAVSVSNAPNLVSFYIGKLRKLQYDVSQDKFPKDFAKIEVNKCPKLIIGTTALRRFIDVAGASHVFLDGTRVHVDPYEKEGENQLFAGLAFDLENDLLPAAFATVFLIIVFFVYFVSHHIEQNSIQKSENEAINVYFGMRDSIIAAELNLSSGSPMTKLAPKARTKNSTNQKTRSKKSNNPTNPETRPLVQAN